MIKYINVYKKEMDGSNNGHRFEWVSFEFDWKDTKC